MEKNAKPKPKPKQTSTATVELIEKAAEKTRLNWLDRFQPPRWLLRAVACAVLGGQVCARLARGRIHWRNTRDQLRLVGPRSLGVALLTAGFVGMVFTIQFVREFAKLGLTRSVGGVLALALARELTPVVTAIILAGRVGSAFAAELGTMQVSEQVDSLRVLFTDPVDYLVTPRVVACMVAGPILNVLCLCMGEFCCCFESGGGRPSFFHLDRGGVCGRRLAFSFSLPAGTSQTRASHIITQICTRALSSSAQTQFAAHSFPPKPAPDDRKKKNARQQNKTKKASAPLFCWPTSSTRSPPTSSSTRPAAP